MLIFYAIGTVVGDESFPHDSPPGRHRNGSHLTVEPVHDFDIDHMNSITSPSRTRAEETELTDELRLLQIEQQISNENNDLRASKSIKRSRSRKAEPIDEFDAATNPLHEKTQVYKPPERPNTNIGKVFKRIHESSVIIRWIIYITPVVVILLVPLLLGALKFKNASVGGVKLIWFSIWLEIVWLTLWAGRLLSKCLPYPIGLISAIFTNNSKKWRDMAKQLELPATLFFWWLAIEISFLPTMSNHHTNGDKTIQHWEKTTNKVWVAFLVAAVLNFVEKIIIQLIAISFHLRQYADRIELNKFQIASLAKLYKYSKEKIAMEDREFEPSSGGPGSGARTPGMLVKEAQKNTKEAINKFGDVAGKIAGDFTGRQVAKSTHPHQVILALLSTTTGSQVLARRLYRTFYREDTETVLADDLRNAFDNDDEADAAFTMFDKDMNGDISMEELEAVCVEIGRERKSITASLKDLDSVVGRLDDVFLFIVFIIALLVFISLISTSAAGVLTSAGSTVLALSWLFSATAQELLQSIIFVFVKHPFDVGDRVGIYGNTGSQLKGDDYFVKKISLLYTEFKKMEGHIVQAPNSYLNTLFILNQRRSGGLAEAVPVVIKFGTTLDQIEGLRNKLLEFVRAEKREYQGNILTELREVTEAHSLTLNIVFFYKSNWQNELLRLQRRNKFICAMMVCFQELGIEGPRMRFPGMKQSFPVYLQNVPHVNMPGMGHSGNPDQPDGFKEDMPMDPPFVSGQPGMDGADSNLRSYSAVRPRGGSILKDPNHPHTRPRGESLAAMSRRVDFSLGMKDVSAMDMTGDVFEEDERSRDRQRAITNITSSRERASADRVRESNDIGRSTSINSGISNGPTLQRRPTDDEGSRNRSIHRNRFFGRHRGGDDVESGMAPISEDNRIDPRTGIVSPQAWRPSTDSARERPDEQSIAEALRSVSTDTARPKQQQ
jgi:small-conductance mechanosensitive channel